MVWTSNRLQQLGARTELVDIGKQTLPDGKQIPLPNVLLGTLGNVSLYICFKLLIFNQLYFHLP